MKICKWLLLPSNFQSLKNLKKNRKLQKVPGDLFFFLIFLLLPLQFSFGADSFRKSNAQNSIAMPSSPSMPSLSTPSVGSGFYAPGSNDFYYGIQNKNKNSSSKLSSENEKSSVSSDSAINKNESSESLENQKSKNLLSESDSSLALKNISQQSSGANSMNLLTAGDLSAISGLGIFNSISSLLGKSSSSQDISSNSNFLVNQNSTDSKKLEQILSELSDLKKQNASSNGTVKEAQNGFSSAEKTEPQILRFIVNGYDILSTCKKIYFSEQESDGTFLLTGDRKYLSAGKARSETFYFFFHTKGSAGGITKYKVTPAVSQDYENKYSFLYTLTQKNELEAERTGNLITLRTKDSSWKMDLLISM